MIILITGPSGAGKSSFIAKLMAADERLAFSVSATTRPIRAGEVDGRDYDFLDEVAFDALVGAEAFVEWAHVHGCRYGTTHARMGELMAAGKIPVLDIDVQGGVNVIDHYAEKLVSVFLFPPTWAELERRLRSRDTDSEEAIAGRLQTARSEVTFADRYQYWIVNDDLDVAVAKMRAIIIAQECRAEAYGGLPLK